MGLPYLRMTPEIRSFRIGVHRVTTGVLPFHIDSRLNEDKAARLAMEASVLGSNGETLNLVGELCRIVIAQAKLV